MSQPRGAANGAPRSSKGREPHESWRSGDGSSDSFALQYPEVRADLNVKPPWDEGGGAAIKASVRSNGSMLWRGESQEGIDGRDHSWFRRQHGLVTGRRP
jgi:hypothetical protein